jgi:hypothetical protein
MTHAALLEVCETQAGLQLTGPGPAGVLNRTVTDAATGRSTGVTVMVQVRASVEAVAWFGTTDMASSRVPSGPASTGLTANPSPKTSPSAATARGRGTRLSVLPGIGANMGLLVSRGASG